MSRSIHPRVVLLVLMLFLGTTNIAYSQSPALRGSQQSEPLVADPPRGSYWVVRITPNRLPRPSDANQSGVENEDHTGFRRLSRIHNSYDGEKQREIRVYSDGSREVRWFLRGRMLDEQYSGIHSYISTLYDTSMRWAEPGNFDEFSWIRPEHFVGTVDLDGRRANVYRWTSRAVAPQPQHSYDAPEEEADPEPTPPATQSGGPEILIREAIIDEETRLPIRLANRAERRTYTFGSLEESLELPASLREVDDEFTDAFNYTNRYRRPKRSELRGSRFR